MTTRHLFYWLAGLFALLVVSMTIGVIWADTSDVADAFAAAGTLVGVLGMAVLLIGLVFKHTRRQNPRSDESLK